VPLPLKRKYDDHCAIAVSLELLGDRWTLLVVRDLVLGPRRFSELQTNLRCVAPDVLTMRLRTLTSGGIVGKLDGGYALTAQGRALVPTLRSLALWGRDLLPRDPDDGSLSARSLLTSIVLGPARGPVDRAPTIAFNVDQEVTTITFDHSEPRAAARRETATIAVTTDIPGLRSLLHGRGAQRGRQPGTPIIVTGASLTELHALIALA
jgi:DNA-binding HxlR family transcriptional regulator